MNTLSHDEEFQKAFEEVFWYVIASAEREWVENPAFRQRLRTKYPDLFDDVPDDRSPLDESEADS